MSKDNAQLIKAKIKTNAVIKLIRAIQEMNKTLELDEIKEYKVNLSYNKYKDFYKFFIEIYKGTYNPEQIFSIKFSLNDIKQGNYLFGEIITNFLEDECLYSGFSSGVLYEDFFIKGANNVTLFSKIKTEEEKEKYKALKEKIDKNITKKAKIKS